MASRYSCTIKKFKLPPHELPVDFSFLKFSSVKEIQPDMVQSGRICTPLRTDDGKFLAKTIWLNNNKLKDFCDLVEFVGRVLDNPELLTWLDLSFNRISEIDNSILQFQNLKILYLHGNRLAEIKEIVKLKGLKLLRTLVSHGNPVYSKKNYRLFVISVMPQLISLDFSYVTNEERNSSVYLDRRVE